MKTIELVWPRSWRGKTVYATVVVLLASLLLLQSGCAQRPAEVAAQETPPQERVRMLQVSGTGRAEARPDVAVVRLGVRTEAETASKVLAENSERMQKLIGALKEAGVAAEDIQTQSVRLWPRYKDVGPERDGSSGERTLVGYSASNTAQVQVRNLDRLGALLDTAIQAGGNEIQGISFEIDDRAALTDRAREASWQDAQQKAEQLAVLADVTLGDVLSINETSRTPGPVVRGDLERKAAQVVPIEPGTQSVEVSMTVEWSLGE